MTRQMPASLRSVFTDDPNDMRRAVCERKVAWIVLRREQRRPARVRVQRHHLYISVTAMRMMPPGVTRARFGVLDGKLIIQPCGPEAGSVALSRSRSESYGAQVGSLRFLEVLAAQGISGIYGARWNAEMGWLECEREART